MESRFPFRIVVADLMDVISQHTFPERGQMHLVRAHIPIPDAGIPALNGEMEPFLAFPQGSFSALFIRNIFRTAQHILRRAVFAEDRHLFRMERAMSLVSRL